MLTAAQIATGTARLVSGKLTDVDVDSLVSVFRMFFADLETVYGYEFSAKLSALDDTGNSLKQCAQIAACLNKMETLGFGVASFTGELNYKEKDEYWQYVVIAFTKIYPLPGEFSVYDWRRRKRSIRTSSTICTTRKYCD